MAATSGVSGTRAQRFRAGPGWR